MLIDQARRLIRAVRHFRRNRVPLGQVILMELLCRTSALRSPAASMSITPRPLDPEPLRPDRDAAVPIVLIHRTSSEYLRSSLQQARRSNPGSTVHLIGDVENRGHEGVSHHLMSDYFEGADEMARLYRHMSPNGYGIELFCLQRWFVLRNFVRHQRLGASVYIDSDVLLFADVSQEQRRYSAFDLALVQFFIPCTVFLNSAGIIEEFCDFVLRVYRREHRYEWDYLVAHYALRRRNRLPDGVSDMTLFELFHKRNFGRIGDLTWIEEDATFDTSVNAPESDSGNESWPWAQEAGLKKLTWSDGVPYATYGSPGRLIRMKSLHFQGRSKGRMGEYLQNSIRSERPVV